MSEETEQRESSEFQKVMLVPEPDGTLSYCKTVDVDDEVDAVPESPNSEAPWKKVEAADPNNNSVKKKNDDGGEENDGFQSIGYLQLVNIILLSCFETRCTTY